MNTLFLALVFVLGTMIGSFLNVVILRHNTGKTLGGRSGCFSCGKALEWYELIPVLSFLAQRGRCRKCGSKISIQYPLVELSAGLLFLLVFLKDWPLIETVLALVVMSLLVVILVYDLRHMIIPDEFVSVLVAVAFMTLFLSEGAFTIPGLWALLAGPILALPFALVWLLSKGTWMGLGDAKLVLGLGALLGLAGGFAALLYAFWIGALVSVPIVLIQRAGLRSDEERLTMKSEIPFGPFLILGFLLVYLFPNIALAPFTFLYL